MNKLDDLIKITKSLMNKGQTLESAIQTIKNISSETNLIEQAKRKLIEELEKPRRLRDPPILTGTDGKEELWYLGPLYGDIFWPKLKDYWEEKGFSLKAISSIDTASCKIMTQLAQPSKKSFSKRGLVLGYIQSGKTANYTAVISKAADKGYKLFIVLSGITNKLRKQTQERLNQELINLNKTRWVSMTSNDSDFTKVQAQFNIDSLLSENTELKYMCVVKKNISPLNNLLNWLRSADKKILNNCPVLLIDDESDQAGVNIYPDQRFEPTERSSINKAINNILKETNKVVYIGYTATLFANVFINPEHEKGMYPRDFIVSLPKPEDYFGTERIFGRERLYFDDPESKYEGLDVIRTVKEEELPILKPKRSEIEVFLPRLTNSLRNALNYFWMATAARLYRGQEQHSTMLIHTTLYTLAQEKLSVPILKYREEFYSKLLSNDYNLLEELKSLWEFEQERINPDNFGLDKIKFESIKDYLLNIVKKSKIIIENSNTPFDKRLHYGSEQGVYIVIGGNILSRGLTLEGLVVSFFIRISNTYDTLLQMGRWFGYRRGYEDLIRIWMTKQLEKDFYDLATIEQEIRTDIRKYDDEGLTPLDFGLRIRVHPKLSITAKVKMQHIRTASISYSGTKQETTLFNRRDNRWLTNNINATNKLIKKIIPFGYSELDNNRLVFKDVESKFILEFLNNYLIHKRSIHLQSKHLIKYIKSQNQKKKLIKWNVVIRSRKDESYGTIPLGGLNIKMIKRARVGNPNDLTSINDPVAELKGIISKADLVTDFSDVKNIGALNYGDLYKIRKERAPNKGLLLIYPIRDNSEPEQHAKKSIKLDAVNHIIGVGLIFPEIPRDEYGSQTYVTVDLSKAKREIVEDQFDD